MIVSPIRFAAAALMCAMLLTACRQADKTPTLALNAHQRAVMNFAGHGGGWVKITNWGPGQIDLIVIDDRGGPAATMQLPPRASHRVDVSGAAGLRLVNGTNEQTTVAYSGSLSGNLDLQVYDDPTDIP